MSFFVSARLHSQPDYYGFVRFAARFCASVQDCSMVVPHRLNLAKEMPLNSIEIELDVGDGY